MEPLHGVKKVGFGTWKLPPDDSTTQVVFEAIKCGYRHIDCASDYGNEVYVGRGIRKAIDAGLVKRDDLWVTSKLWNTNHAKQHVEPSCRRTLSELNLEYLDLYLVHFPVALAYVPPEENPTPGFFNTKVQNPHVQMAKVPMAETWGAMEELVKKKLTRHIGVSNVDLQLLQDLLNYCTIRPLTNQVEMHLFLQQRVLSRWCEREKIFITAYSPLGAESYYELKMASSSEPNLLTHPVVVGVAQKHNKTPAQVALRWVIQQSPWHVLAVKTKSPGRAQENFESLNFELTSEDMDQLSKIDHRRRYNDPSQYTKDYGWVAIFPE